MSLLDWGYFDSFTKFPLQDSATMMNCEEGTMRDAKLLKYGGNELLQRAFAAGMETFRGDGQNPTNACVEGVEGVERPTSSAP
jgi:hypothetical protein